MDWSLIQTVLILLMGMGVYLRLVTKEKIRREKHLQFRLDEQVRKIREEKEKADEEAAAKAAKEKAEQEEADQTEPITLDPV